MTYGKSTAAAVLAYKRKRGIINRSYQTQADNIVGKMTMASLDREILSKEPLFSEPTQISIIYPGSRPVLRPERTAHHAGIQGPRGLQRGPLLNFAAPSMSVPIVELRKNEIGRASVSNGVGKWILCLQPWIGKVLDPDKPENSQLIAVLN